MLQDLHSHTYYSYCGKDSPEQLIKTAINNTTNKKIYLHLDGKQVNFIGGEGIMVSQPLTEKSLEN